MQIAGFLLLVSGWVLVLAALILLGSPNERNAFIGAGVAVELLGLALVVKSHLIPSSDRN